MLIMGNKDNANNSHKNIKDLDKEALEEMLEERQPKEEL